MALSLDLARRKAFIRRNWQSYEENPAQGFDNFLEWCVDVGVLDTLRCEREKRGGTFSARWPSSRDTTLLRQQSSGLTSPAN
ncbi:hypothetical protein N7524_011703 [Penicillium chrysogenum]|nr:hypothetical protein N7524_011703 [Penicillium chrysogenum]